MKALRGIIGFEEATVTRDYFRIPCVSLGERFVGVLEVPYKTSAKPRFLFSSAIWTLTAMRLRAKVSRDKRLRLKISRAIQLHRIAQNTRNDGTRNDKR